MKLYNGVRLVDGPCLPNVARIDHGAIPMILSMMSNGIQVDLDRFAKMDKELTLDMDRITEEVKDATGYYCNLGSGDQVADLLFKKMGLKQARFKLTAGGNRESVEEEVLLAIQHDHPVVPKILQYKELGKLRGTYVAPMPKLAVHVSPGVWRMFPNLTTTRVPSGRLACKEPNLLAMPTRTERGKDVRRCFVAADGWKIVSIDYSQIEPRVTAHRSMDEGLLRVYQNGEDIYSDFAISAFKIVDQRYKDDSGKWQYPGVDKMTHRYPAKTCVLATFYDVTAKGLLEQMPVVCAACSVEASEHTKKSPRCGFRSFWNEDKCQDLINSFYLKYPGVLEMRAEDHHRLRQKGYLWDMWGRILHVAAIRSVLRWVVSAALREAGNFPIQSGAQGCIKLSMAAVQDDLEDAHMLDVARPILQLHDELIFEARDDVVEDLFELVKWRFETGVPLNVPIKAGEAVAQTWGDLPD